MTIHYQMLRASRNTTLTQSYKKMLRSLSNRSHNTTSFFSVALLLALLCGLTQVATAQDMKKTQKIRIFEQNDICVYEIEEQTDQDLFRIPPRGVVLFKTFDDFEVNIEIKDDPNTGVGGTQGSNTARLQGGQNIQILVVRLKQGKDSQHQVEIQCCLTKNADGTCAWTPVESASSSGLGMLEPAFQQGDPMSGPNAADSSGKNGPVGTGGPTMEVEEDE